MKKSATALAIALVFQFFAPLFPAFAATIDTTAPHGGDYLLVYNASTNITTPRSTGALPSGSMLFASVGGAEETEPPDTGGAPIEKITEIDGAAAYQLQFTDKVGLNLLPQIPAPLNGVNFSEYSIEAAVGSDRLFYSYDMTDDSIREVPSTCQFSGSYCEVYVENDYTADITTAKAGLIGNEFDVNIRDFMLENFGRYFSNKPDGKFSTSFPATNQKIVILLEDIRDAYYYGSGSSYYAGFFTAADLFPDSDSGATGNECAMIHIDIKPLLGHSPPYTMSKGYSTLIHEFQHLINYTDACYQGALNPSWLNEAFSMAAEHMKYGVLNSRINEFNASNTVKNGAVLMYENYDTNNGNLGANYGLPYLFGQYLRVQTQGLSEGGDAIFKTILNCSYADYNDILAGLQSVGYSAPNISTLLRNFRIATLLNESSGVFGFMGDSAFSAVSHPRYTGTGVSLLGSAAVFKAISAPFTPSGQGANIQFAGVSAYTASSESDFVFDSATGTVIGYQGAGGDIVIPDAIGGAPVLQISASAFNAENAFSVTSVVIPASVTHIETGAFAGCPSLSAINVISSNVNYKSDAGVLFNKAQTRLIKYPPAKTGAYTIPSSVTLVSDFAFKDAALLTGVTVPSSVTSLGGNNAVYFDGGPSPYIAGLAFLGCSNLTVITVDGNNPAYSSDANGVLFDKNKTTLIEAPAKLTGAYAVPATVTKIGHNAFYNCPALTSLTISRNVALIAENAFDKCPSLGMITVDGGNGYFSSDGGILFDKTGASLIKYPVAAEGWYYSVPHTVNRIGYGAFEGCGLFEVDIPGVSEIDLAAFNNSPLLGRIKLPSTLVSMGGISVSLPDETLYSSMGAAFGNCPSLAAAYFAGGAPALGDGMFDGAADGFAVYYKRAYAEGFSASPWTVYDREALDVWASVSDLILAEDNFGETEVTALSSGDTVYAVANIHSKLYGKVVFALYSGQALCDFLPIDYQGDGVYSVGYDLEEDFEDLWCKVFVLDSLANMTALGNHSEILFRAYLN